MTFDEFNEEIAKIPTVILTDATYNVALTQIEKYWDVLPNSLESKLLDKWIEIEQAYANIHFTLPAPTAKDMLIYNFEKATGKDIDAITLDEFYAIVNE